jgi:hypothetical protein
MRVTIALFAITTGAVACGQAPRVLTGSLVLNSRDVQQFGTAECQGSGAFASFDEGAEVIVRNESDEIIGTGELGAGHQGFSDRRCEFSFTIDGLPDANFYRLEVAGRDGPTYSEGDLAALDYQVDLELHD